MMMLKQVTVNRCLNGYNGIVILYAPILNCRGDVVIDEDVDE